MAMDMPTRLASRAFRESVSVSTAISSKLRQTSIKSSKSFIFVIKL